jgi:hypothetical protein
MNDSKRDIIILAATGIAFIILVGVYGALNIQYAPAFTLVLYAGLIVVTMFYAYYSMEIARATRRQADASVKLANETKEQRLAMYKPHITLKITGHSKGEYFVKEIGIELRNDQGGTAINVELYAYHPLFEFRRVRHPFHIPVGQAIPRGCHVEKPSVENDPGVPIHPVILVIANYEDVSGNPWHSVLELLWDPTSKDVTPGAMQVAVSEHFDSGEKSND